jgi:hypothetical protein
VPDRQEIFYSTAPAPEVANAEYTRRIIDVLIMGEVFLCTLSYDQRRLPPLYRATLLGASSGYLVVSALTTGSLRSRKNMCVSRIYPSMSKFCLDVGFLAC